MRLSVVATTYNHPEWLEKVLWGFEAQTFRLPMATSQAITRDDLVHVNGIDERLEWGGLDREIGERLGHAGSTT